MTMLDAAERQVTECHSAGRVDEHGLPLVVRVGGDRARQTCGRVSPARGGRRARRRRRGRAPRRCGAVRVRGAGRTGRPAWPRASQARPADARGRWLRCALRHSTARAASVLRIIASRAWCRSRRSRAPGGRGPRRAGCARGRPGSAGANVGTTTDAYREVRAGATAAQRRTRAGARRSRLWRSRSITSSRNVVDEHDAPGVDAERARLIPLTVSTPEAMLPVARPRTRAANPTSRNSAGSMTSRSRSVANMTHPFLPRTGRGVACDTSGLMVPCKGGEDFSPLALPPRPPQPSPRPRGARVRVTPSPDPGSAPVLVLEFEGVSPSTMPTSLSPVEARGL